ncbi:MAG TPA: DoxX-like family protein, partial [Usitatibacter sp.]|nr:DoxX-like family protein [Usitatibacter sp.]
AMVVPVPVALAKAAAKVGDVIGGPLNSTAWSQLEHGNTGDADAYARQTGLAPLGWQEALGRHPAHAQDLWHARLYFVRPLLRITLALLWIGSGAAGWAAVAHWAGPLADGLGVSREVAAAVLRIACVLDVALGALVAARWRPALLAAIQAAVVIAYTAVAGLVDPALWTDPFGPLLKNLPILAAIAALAAIEEDR